MENSQWVSLFESRDWKRVAILERDKTEKPVVNKYHEGKLKSTPRGDLTVLNLAQRKCMENRSCFSNLTEAVSCILIIPYNPSWNTDQGVWQMYKLNREIYPVRRNERSKLRAGESKVRLSRPERWWTIPGKDKVRGNSDGSSNQYWRANRLVELGIGAKD